MMKKMTVGALLVGAAIVAGTVWADGWRDWLGMGGSTTQTKSMATQTVTAAPVDAMAMMGNALDIQPTDRVIGSMTAPVTLIEYASMTCSHCADFSKNTMPSVRKEWIATGKLKYVLRDLAWDNLAVGMAKVARCAPVSQFEPIATAFFSNQEKIVTSNDSLGEIKKIAATFGMDGAKVDACVKDAQLQVQVETSKQIAMEGLGVRGTPALFVNGTKLDGAMEYEELKKILDAAYAKATAKK
jgi:protein-disulfide isomerase